MGYGHVVVGISIRPFEDADLAQIRARSWPFLSSWLEHGPDHSLFLVAVSKGEVVGHLQAVDKAVPEPSRRPGQCHFVLEVVPAFRQRGIGTALYDRLETFSARIRPRLLYAAYLEGVENPAAKFLARRGFVPLERYLPAYLDLATFDAVRFNDALDRVRAQGIELTTYSGVGDSPANRRSLFELEQRSRAVQPFREVGAYVPEQYDFWERGFLQRDPGNIFVALADHRQDWAGVVTGMEWYFTGVDPAWTGRGIATALKVLCLAEAKARGMARMETENHEDNTGMIAINRKLGFVYGPAEVACVKRLSW